jgi:hypothetical protein
VGADDHHAQVHGLGSADHDAATLAQLNTKVSDATLDDSSDPRTPTAHGAAEHTGTIGAHSQLSGVGSDDHHAQLHAASHASGQPDAMDHGDLAGLTDVADHPGYLDLAGTRSMTGPLQMGSQDIRSAKAADFGSGVDHGGFGATPTINWTQGNKQKGTLNANATITFVAPNGWGNMMLELMQDATGGRTVTWPAAVKWGGGSPPDFGSMSANEIALVALFYDGTNYLAEARLGYA